MTIESGSSSRTVGDSTPERTVHVLRDAGRID